MRFFHKVIFIVLILLHKGAGVGLFFLLVFGLGAAFEEKYPQYFSRHIIFWALFMFIFAVAKGIVMICLKKYDKQWEIDCKTTNNWKK